MMMRLSPALPLLALLASCGSNAPETAVDDVEQSDPLTNYRKLVGEWMDSTSSKDYTCYERWSAQGDSALIGLGHVIAKGDTVFIEHLQLGIVAGQVVYSARVGSQNNGAWVPFTAEHTGQDTLMFENGQHDFPQCITYTRDSAGGWDVAVTGNENGLEKSDRFHFKRR